MPHDIVNPAIQGQWMGAIRTPGDSAVFNDDAGVYPVHMILRRCRRRVLTFAGGGRVTHLPPPLLVVRSRHVESGHPHRGSNRPAWFLPQFDDDPIANPPPPTRRKEGRC